ncbi:dTDP-4-dehydrorhamnose 3,5-epimerase [Pinibacter aurantiacus]|uniref:dTDP-4-dehydrorhamnose 3,5-epimerase n=1 Tax=Pinibacter aurantiacus TaxID=2851599 RepID=A0A9E2SD86_9BACT|nr:dTDP-4-dehydrorhamnose 3,5-epimerase [Pinibacter aurantiacus]MBV4359454.1 dTDP-4-dehydrorhamnose 3,5-epimerase [Pinibacter aurantiacus]
MIFTPTSLQGSFVIDLNVFRDGRGWFARTYCKDEFAQIGHDAEWVQMNHSFTTKKGTIRGMHFQLPPFEEIKMVRCISGAVYDVIIDLRKDSATFLQYFGTELSAENRKMLYIPKGFAHGFQAVTENAELIYHHSQFYKPGVESGIRYDDPAIGIQWPLAAVNVSDRDLNHPLIDNNFKGI